jgi:hypothetical protein
VKRECLHRVILFGEAHLRQVVSEYVAHYKVERTYQGLGNELIGGEPSTGVGEVVETERLGGLLCSYRRAA